MRDCGCLDAFSSVGLADVFDDPGVLEIKVVACRVSVGGEGVGMVIKSKCAFVFVYTFLDWSGGFSYICFRASGAGDGVYTCFLLCGFGGFGNDIFDGGRGAGSYGSIGVVEVVGDHV